MSKTLDTVNLSELLGNEIVIDKIDAASRQLVCSVDMFFCDGDVVSQHTLISAAHGILYNLAQKKAIAGSIKDSPLIRREVRKEFSDAINLPQNFFKHANRDSDGKLTFRYHISYFYLFDAIRLFVLLSENVPYEIKVFLMWFQLRHPDILCFPPAEQELKLIRENITKAEDFKLIARKLIENCQQHKK
jgi:hypothetical protein